MLLDENTGEVISLGEAKGYIDEFSKQYPNEVKGFFVGSNNVKAILEQEDCIGVRIYNGYNSTEGRMNQVFVGVDTSEKDMTNGIIVDRTVACPDYCDFDSELIK
ncbi:hypothetical protein FLJC2902T_12920 [Flavobacterium limnosediminis JC2902]|uniref:Uncharacterized protein n=1 Tax=Flavobacterium limnosediminis JC2902 TaxID=1341181 RepID=V6SQ13_9FLAO|nr:hypothetical protein [Flavobacterium limnosediminis]ESU28701.1 hypothetical protein FLJC2902T_12920 [Flavobacterium limnosediminis JC2902]